MSFRCSSCGRINSASATIVRNFHMRKGSPPRPVRRWPKSTGPSESTLMATAITASSGERIRSPSPPADNIESSLGDKCRPRQVRSVQVHDGNSIDVLDLRAHAPTRSRRGCPCCVTRVRTWCTCGGGPLRGPTSRRCRPTWSPPPDGWPRRSDGGPQRRHPLDDRRSSLSRPPQRRHPLDHRRSSPSRPPQRRHPLGPPPVEPVETTAAEAPARPPPVEPVETTESAGGAATRYPSV